MVDLSFLEKFTKGNNQKMKRYVSMYLTTAPETFERMNQNIKDKSWSDLAINAHSLKPQVEFMGIGTLKELLNEIETNVRSEKFTDLKNLFEKAKSIHIASELLLQEYLSNN